MIILGIETSCDETALALIETRGSGIDFEVRVIHSLVHSQAELHSAYGGVYPTLAKREHSKNLLPLLEKLLQEAELSYIDTQPVSSKIEEYRREFGPQNPELIESMAAAQFLSRKPAIDRIAVTEGPGLEPALWVGIIFARMLADLWKVPTVPIDHMEGHVVGSLLPSDAPRGAWQKLHPFDFPALALLISGGHTELIRMAGFGRYEIIGSTKDDAVGEAFDKAARLLGLPYPGGPHLSRLAAEGRAKKLPSPISLPRPMMGSGDLQFSFSGLKTAVLYAVRQAVSREGVTEPVFLSDAYKKGLAREFEDAVTDTLDAKTRAAMEQIGARALILGGGAAANSSIRSRLTTTATEYGIPIFLPSPHISGDNALMIALAGALHDSSASLNTKTPGEIRAHGTKKLGK